MPQVYKHKTYHLQFHFFYFISNNMTNIWDIRVSVFTYKIEVIITKRRHNIKNTIKIRRREKIVKKMLKNLFINNWKWNFATKKRRKLSLSILLYYYLLPLFITLCIHNLFRLTPTHTSYSNYYYTYLVTTHI